MFAGSALIGFGQGFQPVCGTNFGAGKKSRVREAFYFCLKLGCVTVGVLSLLGVVFAPQIIALFRNDPKVVEIGAVALRAQVITLLLAIWIILTNMMLQTIGYAGQASLVAASRQGLFFIPAVFFLPQYFGLFGVQIAQSVADVFSFLLALPLALRVLKSFRTDDEPAQTR